MDEPITDVPAEQPVDAAPAVPVDAPVEQPVPAEPVGAEPGTVPMSTEEFDAPVEQPVPAEPVGAEPGTVPMSTEEFAAQAADVTETPVAALVRDVHAVVSDIEDVAIFWGGDVGTQLRHLVAELRSHL